MRAWWTSGLLLLGLGACSEPRFAPLLQARDAWDQGEAALKQGDFAAAASAYELARQHDPTSVPLALSHAHALAAGGDLTAAEALLSRVIQGHPDAGEAWYNRACYRVRLGRLDEAAPDLRRALELGVRSPLEAAADPDLAPVAQEPAFAELIPPQPLLISAKGPDGAVFIGGLLEIVLQIVSLPDTSLAEGLVVGPGPEDPGCLKLIRVVEDGSEAPGVTLRTLTLQLRATATCEGKHPGFVVRAGGTTASTPPLPIVVEAPAGAARVVAPPLPRELPIPSVIPGSARHRLRALADGVMAMGPPSARFTATPIASSTTNPNTGNNAARRPEIVLELRRDGQPLGAGAYWSGTEALRVEAEGFSAESQVRPRDLSGG